MSVGTSSIQQVCTDGDLLNHVIHDATHAYKRQFATRHASMTFKHKALIGVNSLRWSPFDAGGQTQRPSLPLFLAQRS